MPGRCVSFTAMRFDLTDLRLFLHVAAAGTITGGAQRAHMTLASASERIRGMEQSLGAPLLARSARGVQPTQAGHTLLRHARLVLRQMEELQSELVGQDGGLRGHIHLMCNTSALAVHLPEVLSGFLALHPRVSMELEERPSDQIVQALRHALCDVGLVSDAVDCEGLQCLDFRDDPLCVIVARNHPLAARRRTALPEVASLPFVGLGTSSALQVHLDQHAGRLGLRLGYRIRVANLESVCRMVGLGVGVAVVPRIVATRVVRSMRIHPLALVEPWAARKLVLCARNFEALPQQARELVAHLTRQNAPTKTNGLAPCES